MPSPTKLDDLIAQFGEFLSPRPQQTQAVFPAPQRMFDPASPAYKPMTERFGPTPGGRYLGMGPGGPQDITGARPASATVSTPATGKASFQVSPQQVEQTGTPGKGKVKTNLFKRRAGWQWEGEPPPGYPANPPSDFPIVSVEKGGQHYYGLQADFPKGVDLARYPGAKSEPRLRPTTTGDVYPGTEVGKINIRGKSHPVYDNLTVKQLLAAGVPASVIAGGLMVPDDAEAAPFGTLARELGVPTQKAWHGSPHRFEEDRLLGSKRLTGEGNEAYAAGRYVSLNEGVARGYRDALSSQNKAVLETPRGVISLPSDTDYLRETSAWHDLKDQVGGGMAARYVQMAAQEAARDGIDPVEALARIHQREYKGLDPNADHQANPWFNRAREFLAGSKSRVEGDQGGFYGVEIPATDQLLDWDAPISMQPEAVLQPLQNVWSDMYLASAQGVDLGTIARMDPVQRRILKERIQVPPMPEGATGQQLYEQLAQDLGSKQKASEYLNQKGIRGTTYIGVESQERNAILFGDEATNVFSKDGQPFGEARDLPEVEELDAAAFADLFAGKRPAIAAGGAATAGLLASQGAAADEVLQADAQRRAAEAYDPVAALREAQKAAAGRPQQVTDNVGLQLQESAARIAEEQMAADRQRAQERAGGLVEAGTGLLGQVAEAIPKNIRENPVAQLGAELTGLPGLKRAGEEYLSGVEQISPESALDVAGAAIPLLPVGKALKVGDQVLGTANQVRKARAAALSPLDRVNRPGAPGYRGATPGVDTAGYTAERVEIPRLRSANAGRAKGSIVGTPRGVEPTEENIERLADEYAGRVETALRTGVEPGYFYEEGARDIGKWTGGKPEDQARFAGQLAATSPQAPVSTNMMWAVRGNEQQALGYPVLTGKSPGQVRKDFAKIEETIAKQRAAGEAPTVQVGGPKTKPFGQLLNKEPALGPNDRWEMFSIGYDRNASFSPQERQMAHYIRQRAVEKLREKGVNLDIGQAQELNWQAVRAPETRTEMIPGEGDTFQHSIKPHRVQHNYEIAPGSEANHFPEWGNLEPEKQAEIARRLNSAFITPEGRDQLVAATGGRIQPGKFTETQGNFEGVQSTGYKTYSAAPVEPNRGKGGLEKATQERLTATESGRSLALGQAAGSAYVSRGGQASTGANEMVFGLNAPLTPEETGNLQKALNDVFGENKVFPEFRPEGVALVEWESPLRLRAAEGEFNQYGRNVKFKKPTDKLPGGGVELEIKSKAAAKRLKKEYGDAVTINERTGKATIAGQRTDWERALATGGGYNRIMDALGAKANRSGVDYALRDGVYAPLNWKEGQATSDFLSTLKAPAQRQAFDSPEVRGIMGRLADAYDSIVKDGLATPNPKLHRLVRAWSEKGIEEVERLAKAGLAPAAAIGTAVALYNQQAGQKAPAQPGEI